MDAVASPTSSHFWPGVSRKVRFWAAVSRTKWDMDAERAAERYSRCPSDHRRSARPEIASDSVNAWASVRDAT